MVIKKTEPDWTPEHVRRLWDWYSSNPQVQSLYFTHMVGDGIAGFLDATGRLKGKALDYGCGNGYLLGHLLARGLECNGVDLSAQSVASVNASFKQHPRWKGAATLEGVGTPYPDGHFDVITCVETFEHLPGSQLNAVLKEMRRVLKADGLLLVTTPASEKLEDNSIYCPFCDSSFHKWQHFRSFSPQSMSALLADNGFSVALCRAMDFAQFQPPSALRFRDLVKWPLVRRRLGDRVRQAVDRVSPRPFPAGRDFQFRLGAGHELHLCALATKAAAAG